jgi:hypothetical protein
MAHGAMKQLYPNQLTRCCVGRATVHCGTAIHPLDDESRTADSRFITLMMRITGARALKISNTRMSF